MMLLTKTDYVEGIHCKKNLWMKKFKKAMKTSLDQSTLANIEEGHKVGDMATTHPKFKGGKLIKTLNIKQSLKETKDALKTKSIIFEAAFSFKLGKLLGFIRTDIIIIKDKHIDLYEVKSATNTKDRHYNDIAYQKWILEQNGYTVNTFIMKPNKNYIRGSKFELTEFFMIEAVDELIIPFSKNVNSNIDSFKSLLSNKKEYRGYFGSKCKTPFVCPFFKYCEKSINQDSVSNLSRLHSSKKKRLSKLKIKYIKDIPTNFPLTDKQELQREVAISEKPFINKKEIKAFLKTIKFPIHHLDFETYSNSIPRFKNTKPNQQLTFQASIHKEFKNGKIEHKEFIHTNKSDPRLSMIHFLLESLKGNGTITVWHKSFEIGRIRELAAQFPKYKKELLSLVSRVVDLEEIFTKRMIYKHEFKGKTSIKVILPAMSETVSYDRLEVQNGADAQAIYQKMINGEFKGGMFHKVKNQLLDYCELDTFAMKIILDEVRELA